MVVDVLMVINGIVIDVELYGSNLFIKFRKYATPGEAAQFHTSCHRSQVFLYSSLFPNIMLVRMAFSYTIYDFQFKELLKRTARLI